MSRTSSLFALLLGALFFLPPGGWAQETGSVEQHKRYALSSEPGGRESEVVVSDRDSGKLLHRIPVGRGVYRLVAYPPEGRLYVLTRGEVVDIWVLDGRTDRVVGQFNALPEANDLALNGEGSRLYVAAAGVQVIDTTSGQELGIIPLPPTVSHLTDIQVAPDGASFLVRAVYQPTPDVGRRTSGGSDWLLLRPDPAGNRGEFLPYIPPGPRPPAPGPRYIGRSGLAAELTIPGPRETPAPDRRLLLVASKNRSYLLVTDPLRGSVQGMIPVDTGVDAFLVSADRTRGYAFHRSLGQISYLHLQPDLPTTYSVFRRVRLPSFTAPNLELTEQGNRIYLWDGRAAALAAVDIYGEKVQPILQPEALEARLFRPIHHVQESQRYRVLFYLRAGRIYAEDMEPRRRGEPPRTWPVKVEGPVASLTLTADQRYLYAVVPSRRAVAVIDTLALRPVGELPVGENPQEVVMASDHDLAYVLNVGDASITVLDTLVREVVKTWPLPDLRSPRRVRIYDPANRALLQVHLPVYTDDRSLHIAPLP